MVGDCWVVEEGENPKGATAGDDGTFLRVPPRVAEPLLRHFALDIRSQCPLENEDGPMIWGTDLSLVEQTCEISVGAEMGGNGNVVLRSEIAQGRFTVEVAVRVGAVEKRGEVV